MPEKIETYIYTAAQIEVLTNGDVKLKTINNWATAAYWLSILEPGRRGYPRKYSRENVIEAVLAAKFARIGMDRALFREFLAEQAALAKGLDVLFAPASEGDRLSWMLTTDYAAESTDTATWRLQSLRAGPLTAGIAELGDVAVIIPISNLVWQVDQYLSGSAE